jgi:hypothetical protein
VKPRAKSTARRSHSRRALWDSDASGLATFCRAAQRPAAHLPRAHAATIHRPAARREAATSARPAGSKRRAAVRCRACSAKP